jgi:hypothetical protein
LIGTGRGYGVVNGASNNFVQIHSSFLVTNEAGEVSVDVRPFLPSTLPRKLAAFFTFDPLVLPDLFFDKVGHSLNCNAKPKARY